MENMQSMDCELVQNRLSDFLSGDVSAGEVQNFLEHLAQCPGCKKEWLSFDSTWKAVGVLTPLEPEPGYVERFWQRLPMQTPWYEKLWASLRPNLNVDRLMPIAGVLSVFVLVAGVTINQINVRETEKILTALSQEDIEFIENMDLMQALDVLVKQGPLPPGAGLLPSGEKLDIRRLDRWRDFDGRSRDVIKADYRRFKRLSPAVQERLKNNWREYKFLDSEARTELRRRFALMQDKVR